jgi:transposase InsO family protein
VGICPYSSPNQSLNLCRLLGVDHPVDAFQMQLPDNEFVQSMSRKGDRCGNAAMESFFGKSKQDEVHRVKYKTDCLQYKTSFNQ